MIADVAALKMLVFLKIEKKYYVKSLNPLVFSFQLFFHNFSHFSLDQNLFINKIINLRHFYAKWEFWKVVKNEYDFLKFQNMNLLM